MKQQLAAAAILGRLGGLSKSTAKARAARINGRLGGRKPKKDTMKADQIEIGKLYIAKVSGRLVSVRVNDIVRRTQFNGTDRTQYVCTNVATKREITVKSPQRFRVAI